KGSGVLPAGRLAGLRCFTIRKAKGKNNKKSSRPAAILVTCYSINPLTPYSYGFRLVRYGVVETLYLWSTKQNKLIVQVGKL
ncbi:hypothetical protein ACPOM7_29365, partial [Peribacillus castrilensis]|uniref:hypothetical protein n=2 Tax=Bacillaceae TaxID=186817 RepID=UPI003C79E524